MYFTLVITMYVHNLCDCLPGVCDDHAVVYAALELTNELLPLYKTNRWFGEPVKLAILPTSAFVSNKKG